MLIESIIPIVHYFPETNDSFLSRTDTFAKTNKKKGDKMVELGILIVLLQSVMLKHITT